MGNRALLPAVLWLTKRENTMSEAGRLQRVVLIRVGKMEFANVELDESVHLHGGNNIGKSTVVGSIQFLFIRNVKEMAFGENDSQSTKDYYFGDEASMMIFECLTADNRIVTIVVRNDGRIGKSEFQRVIYLGGYRESDYFDDNDTLRSREEIDALLSDRGLRPLDPQHLPNVLSGIRGEAPPDLPLTGILPLKRLEDYSKFVVLFRNLLKLSKLDQHDLKDVFLSIYRKEMDCQPVLDLSAENRQFFATEEKERTEIRLLKGIEPRVADAVGARKEWMVGRKRIPAFFQMIEERRRAEKQEFETKITERAQATREKGAYVLQLDKKLDVLQEAIGEAQKESGRFEAMLREHDEEKANKGWGEFVLSLEEESANNLQREINNRTEALGAAKHEPIAVLESRLSGFRSERDDLVRKRDNFADLLGTKLCEVAGREDVGDAFRLVTPQLLGLSTLSEARISDTVRLIEATRQLAAAARNGDLSFAGLAIATDCLEAPNLNNVLDVDAIQARISVLDKEIERTSNLIETAKIIDVKAKEIDTLRRNLTAIQENILLFKKWETTRVDLRPTWDKSYTQKRGEVATLTTEARRLQGEISQENESLAGLQKEIERLRGAIMDRSSGKCTSPDWPNWQQEIVESPPLERYKGQRYEEMVTDYGLELQAVQTSRRTFEDIVASLRSATQGQYDGENDDETLDRLDDAIQKIAEKEAAHQTLVRNLAASLNSGVAGVKKGIRTLDNKVKSFNRHLSGMKISDLQRIEIAMFEKGEETRVLDAIEAIAGENQMLFADPRSIDEVKRRVEERPKISVVDLFGLEFTVVDAAGKRDRSDDIRHVHSEGTTVSVKILISIMLLREFLANRHGTALPFYIDEVEKLDLNNLRNIMRTATDLGFLPILASPKAMGAAKYLYHVRSAGNGGSVIDPRGRIIRAPVVA